MWLNLQAEHSESFYAILQWVNGLISPRWAPEIRGIATLAHAALWLAMASLRPGLT